MKSLFEEKRKPGHLFFNTRIVRVTEVLLYSVRLYNALKVDADSQVLIRITHSGLKDRILSASGDRHLSYDRKTIEDKVFTEVKTTLGHIESDLVKLVDELTRPLFAVFDFYRVDMGVLKDIVDKFVEGKVG